MTYRLGVDLGTTYTAAAVARGPSVEMLGLSDRGPVIPSVVCLRADGTVLVGDEAERRAASEPDRVAREFKRRIGDSAPLLVGGTPIGAEALQAELLEYVVERATTLEGGPPDDVVVTHPANWGPYKRELLVETIREADLDPDTVRTLTEPEAAAIHYASQQRVDEGAVVAVYDLGGGTFDAAVLRRTADGYEILGRPTGIERLGGIDFDEAVFDHVREQLDAADGDHAGVEDDEATRSAWAALRRECVAAKESLASATDTDVQVALPGLRTQVRLTRSEFEEMIAPAITRTTESLTRALESAGVNPEQLTSVLLVGGSSRIPLVGQQIAAALGRPVAVDAHPKYAIAKGAALSNPAASPAAAPSLPASTLGPTVAGPPPGSFAVAPVPAAPVPGAPPTTPVVPVGETERPAVPPSPPIEPPSTPPVTPPAGPVDPAGPGSAAPRKRLALLLGAVAAAVLVVVAVLVLGGGDDEPEVTAEPVTDVTDAPEPSSTVTEVIGTGEAENVDAGLELPRSVTFGHLVVTLDEARLSNIEPNVFPDVADPATDVTDTTHLFVTASMAFERDYPGTSETVEVSQLSVRLADDTVVAGESVRFASSFFLNTGSVDDIEVAFELGPDDLDGAVLVVDDRATEPAELPLTGVVADDPYPVSFAVDEGGDATLDSKCLAAMTVTTVEWDLDAGIDHNAAPIDQQEPRATKGERWLRATVEIRAANDCPALNVFEDDFRLGVDGLQLATSTFVNELMSGGQGLELILGYPVETDAGDVALTLGSPGGTQVAVPIPRPDEFP